MCVDVCYENVFALQLYIEGVQKPSDRRPSEDYSDEETWRSASACRTHGTSYGSSTQSRTSQK